MNEYQVSFGFQQSFNCCCYNLEIALITLVKQASNLIYFIIGMFTFRIENCVS